MLLRWGLTNRIWKRSLIFFTRILVFLLSKKKQNKTLEIMGAMIFKKYEREREIVAIIK